MLGAGASYVHGAPLADQLLPYARAISPSRNDARLTLVRRFLHDVFHFNAIKRDTRASSGKSLPRERAFRRRMGRYSEPGRRAFGGCVRETEASRVTSVMRAAQGVVQAMWQFHKCLISKSR